MLYAHHPLLRAPTSDFLDNICTVGGGCLKRLRIHFGGFQSFFNMVSISLHCSLPSSNTNVYNVEGGKDRTCRYSDGDLEDLSLNELLELVRLAKERKGDIANEANDESNSTSTTMNESISTEQGGAAATTLTNVTTDQSHIYVDSLSEKWLKMTKPELRNECQRLHIDLRGIRTEKSYLKKLEAWKENNADS